MKTIVYITHSLSKSIMQFTNIMCITQSFGTLVNYTSVTLNSLDTANVQFDWLRANSEWHLYFGESTEQKSWNYFLCIDF